MSKADAVVLAGALAVPDPDAGDGAANRAMAKLGDKTMLQWVVDALRSSPSVGRLVAVGQVSAVGLDQVIEPGGDLVENLRRGIDAVGTDRPVLVASSDIPLLTPGAVEDFLGRAESAGADLVYPIVPKAHCEARYPGLKRTYVRTADGIFTGGNLMLVRPQFVEQNWHTIAAAYACRKHTLKLARMIGLGVLARVLVGQLVPCVLRVSLLERAASRMLGARVAAVVSAYPEIGEDVDKPSDLAAVREILAKQIVDKRSGEL